jgi:hypothetical protein
LRTTPTKSEEQFTLEDDDFRWKESNALTKPIQASKINKEPMKSLKTTTKSEPKTSSGKPPNHNKAGHSPTNPIAYTFRLFFLHPEWITRAEPHRGATLLSNLVVSLYRSADILRLDEDHNTPPHSDFSGIVE